MRPTQKPRTQQRELPSPSSNLHRCQLSPVLPIRDGGHLAGFTAALASARLTRHWDAGDRRSTATELPLL